MFKKTMRTITQVVIHHTAVATTTQPDDAKVIKSISKNHKDRIGQPADKNGSTIAYHYYIGKAGNIIQTRDIESVGWADSNLEINNKSINIVLHGAFDSEKPSKEQLSSLDGLLKQLLKERPALTIH